MNNPNIIDYIIRRKWLFIVLSGFLLVVFILFNYSFLSITVTGNTSGEEITYKIVNQDSEKVTTKQTNDNNITKLVKKGSYQITVTQDSGGGFSVIKTSGFLQKTSSSIALQPERKREFVGYNPEACMSYRAVLVSYGCTSLVDSLAVHEPARGEQATFTKKNPYKQLGIVEGIIQTNKGPVGLFFEENINHVKQHFLHLYDNNYKPVSTVTASALNGDDFYRIKSIKDGFVIYNRSFTEVFYYSSFDSKPLKVNVSSPDNDDLEPVAFNVNNQGVFAVLFSSAQSTDKRIKTEDIKNTFVITNREGSSRKLSFDGHKVGRFVLCEASYICMLNDDVLEVYEFSEDDLSYKFKVINARSVENFNGMTILTTDSSLLRFNAQEKSASIDYNFGDYESCGVAAAHESNYVACVRQQNGRKAALAMQTGEENTDNIDKKALELSKVPEIDILSVYKQKIIIVPDVGDVVYVEELDMFDYDPVARKEAAAAINQRIRDLDISQENYTIINILD